ncbi:MAG: ATP-binding protein [Polyangiales bacterium]
MGQVLSNLLRNAILHGDPALPIDLTATGDGDAVLLAVHNGGPPIPGRALETMFDPNIRHASEDQRTERPRPVHRCPDRQRARRQARRDVDRRGGTTFRVQLPRRPASKPPSDVRAEKPGRSG